MIAITRCADGSYKFNPEQVPSPILAVKRPVTVEVREMPIEFEVETPEGTMKGKAGDFLITGVQGEMYPCDRNIFFKTYHIDQ